MLYNDTTASETIVTASGTVAVPLPAAPWTIGAAGDNSSHITGLMDEYTINGRILGVPDIRQIRNGVYDGPLSNRVTGFGVQTLHLSTQKPNRVSSFGVQVLIAEPGGPARVTTHGVQVLHLSKPLAVKVFPVLPSERVFESQSGKRVFPLP